MRSNTQIPNSDVHKESCTTIWSLIAFHTLKFFHRTLDTSTTLHIFFINSRCRLKPVFLIIRWLMAQSVQIYSSLSPLQWGQNQILILPVNSGKTQIILNNPAECIYKKTQKRLFLSFEVSQCTLNRVPILNWKYSILTFNHLLVWECQKQVVKVGCTITGRKQTPLSSHHSFAEQSNTEVEKSEMTTASLKSPLYCHKVS